MTTERNFHNEQHLQLRDDILSIAESEFDLDVIRQEKEHLKQKNRLAEEKVKLYAQQIEDLNALIENPEIKLKNLKREEEKHLELGEGQDLDTLVHVS